MVFVCYWTPAIGGSFRSVYVSSFDNYNSQCKIVLVVQGYVTYG